MGRVVRMDYPHGWVEEYEYDSIGQLLNVTDSDPGEATVENDYSYDTLHRVVRAEELRRGKPNFFFKKGTTCGGIKSNLSRPPKTGGGIMTRIFEVSPYYISSIIIILAMPFLILFALLLLLPKRKKAKVWELIKVLARHLIVLALVLLFLISCHVHQYRKVYIAYKNGEYNEVSGVIEKYNWASLKEHVWFTVAGVEFYCHDNGWAGHPPYKLARTFYNGMPVRVGYIDISDTQREIVYIDLLDDTLLIE